MVLQRASDTVAFCTIRSYSACYGASSWRARERGELIEKELVSRQLTFILIAFRQSVLAWPGKLRASIGAEFTHEMASKARALAHETLKHLEKLPETLEPDWLEKLEEGEG